MNIDNLRVEAPDEEVRKLALDEASKESLPVLTRALLNTMAEKYKTEEA